MGATTGGGMTGAVTVGAAVNTTGLLVGDGVTAGTNNPIVGVAVVTSGVGASVASTGVDDGVCVGTCVSLGSLGGFLSSLALIVGVAEEVDGIGGIEDGRSVGLATGSC